MQPSVSTADLLPSLQGNSHTAHRKYKLVQNLLTTHIEDGTLPAGAPLPSELQLAKQLQLARSTVRQAMAALEQEGLICRFHGRGTYVHADALRRLQQSRCLFALLLPDPELEICPTFQKHFAAAASEFHHQVIFSRTATTPAALAETTERLIQLHVSGVAIVPPAQPASLLPSLLRLQSQRIPVICCCRPVAGLNSTSLLLPFGEIGRRAGELISGHGHRHALFCASSQHDTESWMERGFRSGMGEQTLIHTLQLPFSSERPVPPEAEVRSEIERLFSSETKPTAIFCAFDALAELVFMALMKSGLRVPEDVSLVGFGGNERLSGFNQRLTSIVIDEQQLGTRSVRMLRHALSPGAENGSETEPPLTVSIFPGQTLEAWTCSTSPRPSRRSHLQNGAPVPFRDPL